jgi:hypothetical protein
MVITLAKRRALEEEGITSKEHLQLEEVSSECLSGEVAYQSTLWCKGFFFRASRVKGASLHQIWQQEERAH